MVTEAEALDLAAKAAEWQDWDGALDNAERGEIESIRAHAKTLMENAALKAENERLREAMTAMHKDLLLRAEIDIRDGTKIVHASNGVWLKFCAALKEIEGD